MNEFSKTGAEFSFTLYRKGGGEREKGEERREKGGGRRRAQAVIRREYESF